MLLAIGVLVDPRGTHGGSLLCIITGRFRLMMLSISQTKPDRGLCALLPKGSSQPQRSLSRYSQEDVVRCSIEIPRHSTWSGCLVRDIIHCAVCHQQKLQATSYQPGQRARGWIWWLYIYVEERRVKDRIWFRLPSGETDYSRSTPRGGTCSAPSNKD
jgi:hypothetical protein